MVLYDFGCRVKREASSKTRISKNGAEKCKNFSHHKVRKAQLLVTKWQNPAHILLNLKLNLIDPDTNCSRTFSAFKQVFREPEILSLNIDCANGE